MTLQELTELVKKIPLSSRSQHRQIQAVFKACIEYLAEREKHPDVVTFNEPSVQDKLKEKLDELKRSRE